MTSQSFITIVRRLDRRSAEGAKEALQPYGNLHGDATCKRKVGFATALDRARIVHFLSINVEIDAGLADEATEPPRPPDAHGHLIVEIAADGSASDCLAAVAPILIAHAPDLLTAARLPSEPGELAHALAADQIAIGAGFGKAVGLPFSGAPGLSVRRILDEAELARTVAQWVFEKRDASPRDILREVRGKLWDAGEKWTIAAEPIPWLGSKPFGFWPGLIMTLLPLGLLFLIGLAVIVGALCFGLAWRWRTATLVACVVAVGVAGALYAWFRWSESKDVPQDAAPDAGAVAAIMAQENHAAQNHLFSVSTLKASRIRRLTLRLAFFLIGGLAKYSFRPGFLQDIGSIHFARWFVISGTDRLVFLSNYGGSWEGYLEDFIERASKGLTAIWSNAIGFPRTTNLVRDGAEDGDRFKRWARRHQLPTGLWYSAYPSLTMARIRANAVIRQGIAVAATEGEAADWLACFGSAPPPPDELEAAEIPGLIFGGFSPLPYGQAIIFRLKKGGSPAEWLNLALHDLSYGQGRPDPKSGATLVAFTSTGLAEIGLSADDLATFPAAFQHGMSDPVRARALGDVDADDPKLWNWGSGDNAADGIVLVYAASPGD